MADPPSHGLPDEDVEQLVGRLESLLAQIEQESGPVADIARQAVEGLALMYGTALARVMAVTGAAPELGPALIRDRLVHHLLALHGLHPWPARERVLQALDEIGPELASRGGHVELIDVEAGVARLRWSTGGCRSTAAATEQAIRDAVLAAAPELRDVATVPAPGRPRPAVIPVTSLLHRPAPGGAR